MEGGVRARDAANINYKLIFDWDSLQTSRTPSDDPNHGRDCDRRL